MCNYHNPFDSSRLKNKEATIMWLPPRSKCGSVDALLGQG